MPGLHVLGEANFSDHGANRLGASALMQGLSDGYFVIPNTIGHYFGSNTLGKVTTAAPEFDEALNGVQERINKLSNIGGSKTVDTSHRELGLLMWDKCGMARDKKGLEEALKRIPEIRAEFWDNVCVPGDGAGFNQTLEKAGRVADFLEFAELMCQDALDRESLVAVTSVQSTKPMKVKQSETMRTTVMLLLGNAMKARRASYIKKI